MAAIPTAGTSPAWARWCNCALAWCTPGAISRTYEAAARIRLTSEPTEAVNQTLNTESKLRTPSAGRIPKQAVAGRSVRSVPAFSLPSGCGTRASGCRRSRLHPPPIPQTGVRLRACSLRSLRCLWGDRPRRSPRPAAWPCGKGLPSSRNCSPRWPPMDRCQKKSRKSQSSCCFA